jgi:DNA-binding LacI/PurR family transcriptional regulator
MPGRKDNSLKPSYVEQIVSTLEEKIRAGRYRDSYWLPTERALAEEFRVSRTRVRQALAELERRNLVIREAGCRTAIRREVDTTALTPGKTRRSLGLWIPNEPLYSGAQMVARGVQRSLDARAYRLVFASPCGSTREEDIQWEAEALSQMAQEEDIAGLILWYNGGSHNLPHLRALRAANIPVVFVDRLPPPEFDADYVGIDNKSAAQEVVEHLLAQGHRRIAHVTNAEPVSSVYDRLEGYRQALEEAKLPFRPEYVLSGEVQGLSEEALDAEELAEHLLTLPERPTAVFAVTDYIALTLVAALQARGASVPGDIAVVGFDDLERWGLRKPFLTTVRQPFERIGKEAVKLLDERIQGGATLTYRHRLLDAPLIPRESTRGNRPT